VDVHDIAVGMAVLLSVANGFVDAFTYVAHGGVFAYAQSGNVILLGVSLAHPGRGQAWGHLWPILAFIVGVLAARRLGAVTRWRDPRPVVLAFQVVVLLLLGGAALYVRAGRRWHER
jgi:uncharacterized membrane protein YoaK (UPF0700 family)